MELHPDVQAFLDALRALQCHLEDFDAPWADQVRRAADEVSRSDARGLQRFLGFFGGMGSLNDLVLSRDDAKLMVENDKLDALRSKAWDLANNLRHEIG
ncbi:DUF6966 domain-containing protein [Altererythrobacter sp. Z27]|uniref:DUF6966 domain-containing protein n=1 Tax=Altererythrobacter sp. Z27 TaxID=3461147 RepID=UPI004044B661